MKDVLTTSTMAYCDKMTIANTTPSLELMYRASQGVFDNHNWQGKIYIICGKGNNGGDGMALANILVDNGYEPFVYMIDSNISTDSNYYFEQLLQRTYHRIYDVDECDYDCDIIVDCIFGTGFKGMPKPKYKNVIDRINESKAYKISVDIPSGLDGDSGLYDVCVKADKTICVQYAKSGLYLNNGKDMTGELIIVDIGIHLYKRDYKQIEEQDIKQLFPKRLNNTHKGSYGKSAIFGGCTNYLGAVKLANMGLCSLRSGGGLNVLVVPKSLSNVFGSVVEESTVFAMTDNDGHMIFDKANIDKAMQGVSAVAIGMGIGNNYEQNAKILEYILTNYSVDVLIDADGLNSLALDVDMLKKAKAKVVITPHIKEMSRLCKKDMEYIKQNSIEVAREFAREYGVVVLLKGTSTIVTNGNDVYLVTNGGAELSKGGSGDTLSGVILGLMSQGHSLESSAYGGAYLTAMIAKNLKEEYSEYGVLPSDVAKNICSIIKKYN